jgi:hypothetical protein
MAASFREVAGLVLSNQAAWAGGTQAPPMNRPNLAPRSASQASAKAALSGAGP